MALLGLDDAEHDRRRGVADRPERWVFERGRHEVREDREHRRADLRRRHRIARGGLAPDGRVFQGVPELLNQALGLGGREALVALGLVGVERARGEEALERGRAPR
jgi:hypothetical protein